MTVVSDSSPLITLAMIGCFDFLPELYGTVYVSNEVYKEVAIDGVGLPGATQVSQATWIEVKSIRDVADLSASIANTGLGPGEVSAVILANELSADLVLIDEWRARRYAKMKGLSVIGCVGILEDLYERGDLLDLREVFQKLLANKIRVDLQTLQCSLAKFKLPPL